MTTCNVQFGTEYVTYFVSVLTHFLLQIRLQYEQVQLSFTFLFQSLIHVYAITRLKTIATKNNSIPYSIHYLQHTTYKLIGTSVSVLR